MINTTHTDWRNVGDWERVASGIGGAALLSYGLARRPSIVSALLAMGGVLLLERGLSGHCSFYGALGLSSRDERGGNFGKRGEHSIIDEIERASEASFPASDPPSWSPHTAGRPVSAG